MARFVVGLTGGIGSGKSAASDFLASLGIDIVDADLVARQVVEPGTPCLSAIADHFGPAVIDHNGQLNRRALRDIIFRDDKEKSWLNALLHPAIREQLLIQLQHATSPYVVLVAPLLLENQLDGYCDRVLVIDVPEALQVERTVRRDDTDEQQVKTIMSAQIGRQERLQRADDIVSNESDLAHLQRQLRKLDNDYRQLAEGS